MTAVHKANVLPRVRRASSSESVRDGRRRAIQGSACEEQHRRCHGGAARARRQRASTSCVTTNMFGDILSDLAARDLRQPRACRFASTPGADHAVAQAQHGSAPDIAGKDRANPASLIALGGACCSPGSESAGATTPLLRAAAAIDDALESVISDPASRTADLGGSLGTKAFGERVAAQLTRSGSGEKFPSGCERNPVPAARPPTRAILHPGASMGFLYLHLPCCVQAT